MIVRVLATLLLSLGAGLAAWLLLRGGTEAAPAAAPGGAPVPVSEHGLRAHADGRLYWAGPRAGAVYELTETANGSLYVRYLPSGSALGSPRPDFLTVASYPQDDAYAQLQAAARRPGATRITLPDGGLAVYERAHPTSVYLAYPGGTRQIEVYAASRGAAPALVAQGRIRPVG